MNQIESVFRNSFGIPFFCDRIFFPFQIPEYFLVVTMSEDPTTSLREPATPVESTIAASLTANEPRVRRRRSCFCPSSSDHRLSDSMIRGIFLLLGVGILIPWNAFVSAKSYYTARSCQEG